MSKLFPSTALWVLAALPLSLSGCGGAEDATKAPVGNGAADTQSRQADAPESSAKAALNLAQGPDVCFRAIAKHLGVSTKVSEIVSFFSTGAEIDSSASKPEGTLTLCTVEYQNPEDPRKLLSTSMDVESGVFSSPKLVEITVMDDDASAFNLEDFLIPLSEAKVAELKALMETQKP